MQKEPITIGTKEFLRNYLKIAKKAKKGQAFRVVRHSEEMFQIHPPAQKNRYNLGDLKKLRFHGGGKNLSTEIDDIVYGI